MGVRSSWLMLARNWLLARLAASAASLACSSGLFGLLVLRDIAHGGDAKRTIFTAEVPAMRLDDPPFSVLAEDLVLGNRIPALADVVQHPFAALGRKKSSMGMAMHFFPPVAEHPRKLLVAVADQPLFADANSLKGCLRQRSVSLLARATAPPRPAGGAAISACRARLAAANSLARFCCVMSMTAAQQQSSLPLPVLGGDALDQHVHGLPVARGA